MIYLIQHASNSISGVISVIGLQGGGYMGSYMFYLVVLVIFFLTDHYIPSIH